MNEEIANAMGASSPQGGGNIAMPERLLTRTTLTRKLRDITGPKVIKTELNKDKSHGI
jgi:hypothetical protein